MGAVVRGANFGGAGRGAEKCSLGAGWASARRTRQSSVDINAETVPCSLTTGLFSTFRVRTAKLQWVNNAANHLRQLVYFRVFKVSCRNLSPGAKLQIRSPMDEPPNAS